jgi:dihydrofolate reductase
MRKLVVISYLTLDGVMQAPGGKDEDTEGGFKYGGWQLPFFGDFDEGMAEDLRQAGALLLGRKTYDIFASYWPTVGKSVEGWGAYMNNVPKFVASKTLHQTEWQNTELLQGDVAKAVAQLKKGPGDHIQVFGSGDLCQTLMRHNLIDEYFLVIYPMALGKGKRLFRPDGPKQDLELVKSKTTKRGALALTYKVKS